MLESLSNKLRSALDKITSLAVVDRKDVEELVKEVQRTLISADVDVRLVFKLSESIKKRALSEKPAGMTRKEHVIKVVYEELTEIMGREKSELDVKPKKILMVGLFGSGKTTTSAKLAKIYKEKGLKTALICCDTVRPAAYEQLKQLSEKIDVPFYGDKGEKDASKVLKNALAKVRSEVIIVDSSGRSALDNELIREIKEISSVLNPDEKVLVIPADIGQAAREQAKAFHDALGMTDVIVTKMDATAKGGGALTACYETQARVKFITNGEGINKIEIYDPVKFTGRLLGFPDIETLLEKAKSAVDEKKARKIIKGDFDMEDFYSQIESVQNVGSFSQIMDMMGLGKMSSKLDLNVQEEKVKKWKFAIQSMTKEEKANPEIVNSSRISRISKGSGLPEHDIRELMANYTKTKKMMKKISPGKLKRGGAGSLFKQFGL
jgi:signal recognition particle subunit SRP54